MNGGLIIFFLINICQLLRVGVKYRTKGRPIPSLVIEYQTLNRKNRDKNVKLVDV